MNRTKKNVLVILVFLTICTRSFATESVLSDFIEPLFNFYSQNEFSAKGLALGNIGVSCKNNLSGSLLNPATLLVKKGISFEAEY